MLSRKTAASIERTIADRETTAANLAREIEADRVALSDVMDDGPRYDRAFASIAAKEGRLAALKTSLDPLRAELVTAREREVSADLLKRAAALRRQLAAEMKEYATKIEPAALVISAFGERHQRTRWEADRVNEELRAVGRRDTKADGVTYTRREPGFEDIQSPAPEGVVHAASFFHDLYIPAFRAGTYAIWRGKKS
jgi:chromosome segregation ATPase